MGKKILFIFTIFLTTFTLGACRKTNQESDTYSLAVDGQEIIVGLDDTFVPMGFRQKDGTLSGFDIDLAKAVFDRLGLTVRFQAIDWSMKETELKNQTIDLIWNGYSKTPQREEQVLFSIPYLANHQVILTSKENQFTESSQLAGKILGVQSASSGYEALESQPEILKDVVAEVVTYPTFTEGYLDVQAGRIDGLLIDELYANYYLAHDVNGAKYMTFNTDFPSETFAIGMRKSDTLLKEKIDNTLQELVTDGTYGKLTEKWFQENLTLPE